MTVFGLLFALAPQQRGLSTREKNTICTYTSSFLLVPLPFLGEPPDYLITLDCITKAGSFMTWDGNQDFELISQRCNFFIASFFHM